VTVLRVLHLVGSAIDDFYCDLSRMYAADCLESRANPDRYEFHIAYITPDRAWRFPDSLDQAAIDCAIPLPLAEAVGVLTKLNIDVMLPQMFCIPGMTVYRALFDLLNIPYVGNPADLMALTANKVKTKAIVAAAGVKVPYSALLHPGDYTQIALPVVIKPVDTDNSLGVVFVKTAAECEKMRQMAFIDTSEVMVEEFIALGREVRCGIIEREGELVCLPLEEYAMDAIDRPIRSYADKLTRTEDGTLTAVAKNNAQSWIVDPQDPITTSVWDAAKKAHTALGCRHYSLFDFRIDPHGQPWFLEAGLYCSFANMSVITTMAKSAGISIDELFQMLLANAIAKKALGFGV
jgi:D-alanine-D-alanine ligase